MKERRRSDGGGSGSRECSADATFGGGGHRKPIVGHYRRKSRFHIHTKAVKRNEDAFDSWKLECHRALDVSHLGVASRQHLWPDVKE